MRNRYVLIGLLIPSLLFACGNTSFWIDSLWFDSSNNIVIHGYGHADNPTGHINWEKKNAFPLNASSIKISLALVTSIVDSCYLSQPYMGWSGGKWDIVKTHKPDKMLYDSLCPILEDQFCIPDSQQATFYLSNYVLQEFILTLYTIKDSIHYPDSFDLLINFGASGHGYGTPELLSYKKGKWKITPHYKANDVGYLSDYGIRRRVRRVYPRSSPIVDSALAKYYRATPFTHEMYSAIDELEHLRRKDSTYVASPQYKDSVVMRRLEQTWSSGKDTLQWTKNLDSLRVLSEKYNIEDALYWARLQDEYLTLLSRTDTTTLITMYKTLFAYSDTGGTDMWGKEFYSKEYYAEKLEPLLLTKNSPYLDTFYRELLFRYLDSELWYPTALKYEYYLFKNQKSAKLQTFLDILLSYYNKRNEKKKIREYKRKKRLIRSEKWESLKKYYTDEFLRANAI